MSPEHVGRAARIFDAARKGNYAADELPAELGLDDKRLRILPLIFALAAGALPAAEPVPWKTPFSSAPR